MRVPQPVLGELVSLEGRSFQGALSSLTFQGYQPRVATIIVAQNEKGKLGACFGRHQNGGPLTLVSGKLMHPRGTLEENARAMLSSELNVGMNCWSTTSFKDVGRYFLHTSPWGKRRSKHIVYFLTTMCFASLRDVKLYQKPKTSNPIVETKWLFDLADIRASMADVRDERKRDAILTAVTHTLHAWHEDMRRAAMAA